MKRKNHCKTHINRTRSFVDLKDNTIVLLQQVTFVSQACDAELVLRNVFSSLIAELNKSTVFLLVWIDATQRTNDNTVESSVKDFRMNDCS